MREEVAEKILYFYKDRIKLLEHCYEELLSIEFNISMIGISESLNSNIDREEISLNNTIGFNSKLIIPEIFEDFNCSLDLIKLAYFKQSNQVLRNTLELITQLIYSKFILEINGTSAWLNGERGVENISKMTEVLKEKIPAEYKYRVKEIEKFYSLLNRSTHSHKNQLNIKAIGKFEKFGVYGFEHTLFINSFTIHVSCLTIILDILKYFYSNFEEDFFNIELVKKLNSISNKLKVFSKDIENYKKGNYESGSGYLIYKKHMIVKGESILYSYSADFKLHFPSKIRDNILTSKLISKEIDKELVKNKIK